MALLRNLEQSLSGLLEGTVGRVFRNEVRPTEIARKLAREMEINKRVSLSRTYAPTDYLVYLSPEDRSRYAGVEHSIAEELGAYLLEHARRERLVLVRRPLVEFRTDQRLHLGEFGIEARTAPISAEEAPPRTDPVAEPAGREMARQPGEAPRPTPEERAAALRAELQAQQPEPALDPEPEFSPAVPLGSQEPSAHEIESVVDEPAYDDPYAGDPFDDDVSQPDEPHWHAVEDHEPEPEPAAQAPQHEPQSSHDDDVVVDDWLDPVEPWEPEPAPSPPVAQAPPPAAPQPVQPPHPVQPPVPAAPPWIDPTLARQQQRSPIAPPVTPPPLRPRTTLVVDGTPHELHGDVIVLGRSRSADIVISDPSVSRRHLELRRDERGWYALDLGSTNGSTINGAPVADPRRLEPGMRIKLGHAPALIEVR
ncbi:MAG: DUF3662 domain-containing protein [Solirubrobacteraceae bacterium]|nr:DUF3662 domain-containing protein [Solirubrobacteraceae bacterium]